MGNPIYVIAYDVGTTGVKTCLFSITDKIELLGAASEGYNLYVYPDGGAEQDRRLRFSQRRGRIVLEQRQQYHDKNALHLYRREIREVCTGCKTNQHQYAGIGRRQPVHRRIRL